VRPHDAVFFPAHDDASELELSGPTGDYSFDALLAATADCARGWRVASAGDVVIAEDGTRIAVGELPQSGIIAAGRVSITVE
jgi:hypothetical protein